MATNASREASSMFAESTHRRAYAAVALLAGALLALGAFASPGGGTFAPFVALAGIVIATCATLVLGGAFDPTAPGVAARAGDPAGSARDAEPLTLATLAGPVGIAAAALFLFVIVMRAAVAGRLGVVPAAIIVPASFLAVVVAAHRVATAEAPPTLLRRPGFWIVAGATLLYLPLLGSTALIDPWESHYGEVAREMIARDDWISPWWAQDRWFFSKPVLDLWLEAAAMRLFGAQTAADVVLAPLAGVTPRPEWALRMPAFLCAVGGLYLLYKGVARTFSTRAGALTALVLGTTPQFYLMARQATTDMPLVGSLAGAMGLMLVATAADPRELAPSRTVRVGARVIELGAAQLALGAAVLLVLPQILYLASRNLSFHGPFVFGVHADAFSSGSPGNCDLPANAPCVAQAPIAPGFPPVLQAALWAAGLVVLVASLRAERRLPRVAYVGAFACAAVATMAKGPVGVVLPACACLAALAVTGRLRTLARLPIASGSLLVLCATLPWYVAVFSRHGAPFTDELVFRHMIGRATSHLHDTNVGDDVSFRYYVWQLGYALFGWTGLLPVAVGFWPGARPGDGAREVRRRGAGRALALLWLVLTFALFTAMPTKFHHYIFPALPPAALLVGVLLDELAGEARAAPRALAVAALGAAALVLLVTRDLAARGVAGEARLLNLVTYNYQRPWPETVSVRGAIAAFGVALALGCAVLAVPRLRRGGVLALGCAAIGFAVWGLDVYLPRLAPHWGQRGLIEAYYRARASDKEAIAAFNVNWKGENFYTGNHVAVFPAGGRISTWIDARRRDGARAAYFLTEHGRLGALKAELGEGRTLTPLTTLQDDNKIVLTRASWD
jgi:4-amino-4-deoxy-L-arabinose transferase-like glycosyltransferase